MNPIEQYLKMNRIKVRDLREGMNIAERTYGSSYVPCVCIDNPKMKHVNLLEEKERKQWSCKVRGEDGTIIELLETEGLDHYAPELYLVEDPI